MSSNNSLAWINGNMGQVCIYWLFKDINISGCIIQDRTYPRQRVFNCAPVLTCKSRDYVVPISYCPFYCVDIIFDHTSSTTSNYCNGLINSSRCILYSKLDAGKTLLLTSATEVTSLTFDVTFATSSALPRFPTP